MYWTSGGLRDGVQFFVWILIEIIRLNVQLPVTFPLLIISITLSLNGCKVILWPVWGGIEDWASCPDRHKVPHNTCPKFQNRASSLAFGTTMRFSESLIACAQNAKSRGVSRASSPTMDLNHWRSVSIKLITEIGAPQMCEANSVKSSKHSSGAVSSTWYCFNASSRALSLAGFFAAITFKK